MNNRREYKNYDDKDHATPAVSSLVMVDKEEPPTRRGRESKTDDCRVGGVKFDYGSQKYSSFVRAAKVRVKNFFLLASRSFALAGRMETFFFLHSTLSLAYSLLDRHYHHHHHHEASPYVCFLVLPCGRNLSKRNQGKRASGRSKTDVIGCGRRRRRT